MLCQLRVVADLLSCKIDIIRANQDFRGSECITYNDTFRRQATTNNKRIRMVQYQCTLILMFYKQGLNKQEMEVFLQHRLHEWSPPMSLAGRWRDNVQQQSTEVIYKEHKYYI